MAFKMAKDPFSVLSSMQPPAREGALTKLGFYSGKWQQRWFTLKGSELSYSTSRGSGVKGTIFINQSCSIMPVEPSSVIDDNALGPGIKSKQPVPSNAFKIATPWKGTMRTFYIYASSPQDCDGWVAALTALAQPGQQQQQQGIPASGMGDMGNLMALAGQASQMMPAMQGGAQQQQQQPAGGMFGGGGVQQQQQQQQQQKPGAPPSYESVGAQGKGAPSAPLAVPAIHAGPRTKAGERPDPPTTPVEQLPPFPKPLPMQGLGKAGAMDMSALLKMSGQIMGTMQSHQQDPHLSKEDNAMALADKVQGASGQTGYEQQLLQSSAILARDFLPKGIAGVVVTQQPEQGTLAAQYGLKPYDLIFEAEGQIFTTMEALHASRVLAFQQKGQFVMCVYNFKDKAYRDVTIVMPPGKPNAILGIQATPVPPPTPEQLQAAQQGAQQGAQQVGQQGGQQAAGDIYVKGWKKRGAMYVSTSPQYYPLAAPPSADASDIYVKVWQKRGPGMMVSTGQYHPLYNYSGDPGVYTEGWRKRGAMFVSTGSNKYVALPPR